MVIRKQQKPSLKVGDSDGGSRGKGVHKRIIVTPKDSSVKVAVNEAIQRLSETGVQVSGHYRKQSMRGYLNHVRAKEAELFVTELIEDGGITASNSIRMLAEDIRALDNKMQAANRWSEEFLAQG